jgi:hypothetical protein
LTLGRNFSNDNFFASLRTAGFTGSTEDMLFAHLRASGYEGALGDMIWNWLENAGFKDEDGYHTLEHKINAWQDSLYLDIPDIESLHYNFQNSTLETARVLGPALSFSRSSEARYFDSNGILQTAASGIARLAAHYYDGSSWVNDGYRGEGSDTNYATFSEDFTDTNVWSYTNTTLTPDTTDVTAPDGTNTADKMQHTSTSASMDRDAITITDSEDISISVFLRGGVAGWVRLEGYDATNTGDNVNQWINLNDGSIGTSVTNGTGTLNSFRLQDIGGTGWYRANFNINLGAGNTAARISIDNVSADTSTTESTTNTTYLWGFQLKRDAIFSGSYIPTTTTTVTRSADDLSVTGITQPITVFWEGRTAPGGGAIQVLGQIHDGTEVQRVRVERNASDEIHFIVTDNGVDRADLTLGTVADNTNFKVAGTFANTGYKAILNGGTEQTAGAGTAPTNMTILDICRDTAGEEWYGLGTVFMGWNREFSSVEIANLVA